MVLSALDIMPVLSLAEGLEMVHLKHFKSACHILCVHISFFLLNDFYFLKIYLFLKRGERKEKERKRNINVWLPLTRPLLGTWPATQSCALTGNQT